MVKQLSVETLKEWQANGTSFLLLDVRTPMERQQVHIGGEFVPLDELEARWQSLSFDMPVVVYCRSGARSQRAAEFLEHQGVAVPLYNLAGGVLAYLSESNT